MEETQLWNLFDNIKNSFSEPEVNETSVGSSVKSEVPGCTNCGSTSLIPRDGVMACKDCGVSNGSTIDYGSEWRWYGGEDSRYRSNPNRCGGVINPLLQQSSYRTYIQGKGNEYFRKCHVWNNSVYKDQRMIEMFKFIEGFVVFNKIPKNIANIANKVYHEVYPHKLIRGKNVDAQILNIVYYIAKACGIFFTNKEMISMMNAYNKENVKEGKYKPLCNRDFSQGGKHFVRCYYIADQKNVRHIHPTTVPDYIDKYCAMLELPHLAAEAKRVAKFLKGFGVTNDHSYISTAIGVIYYVIQKTDDIKMTKTKVAQKCKGVSASTITKVCKSILKYKSLY